MKVKTNIIRSDNQILTLANVKEDGLYVTQHSNGIDSAAEMLLVIGGVKILFNRDMAPTLIEDFGVDLSYIRIRPAVAGESITLTV